MPHQMRVQYPGAIYLGKDRDWDKVIAGAGYFYGRKKDGSWWMCGANTWGQLGIGTSFSIIAKQTIAEPMRAPFIGEPWALAASPDFGGTYLLARDGTLWSWGARLGAPHRSDEGREWRFRFNRALYYGTGGRVHGISAQTEQIDAFPRKIWSVPEEIPGR